MVVLYDNFIKIKEYMALCYEQILHFKHHGLNVVLGVLSFILLALSRVQVISRYVDIMSEAIQRMSHSDLCYLILDGVDFSFKNNMSNLVIFNFRKFAIAGWYPGHFIKIVPFLKTASRRLTLNS